MVGINDNEWSDEGGEEECRYGTLDTVGVVDDAIRLPNKLVALVVFVVVSIVLLFVALTALSDAVALELVTFPTPVALTSAKDVVGAKDKEGVIAPIG